MRFLQQHIQTAGLIIETYTGQLPLVHHLKNYFAQHKKHGSRDRKSISHICYTYFRMGHAIDSLPKQEAILAALYVCNASCTDWAALYPTNWVEAWQEAPAARWRFIAQELQLQTTALFPFVEALSSTIDTTTFLEAQLVQPNLFARIRPGKEKIVQQKLTNAAIAFERLENDCLSFINGTKLETILQLNKEVVIQDYASQQVGLILKKIMPKNQQPLQVWDCCAASGGKSILAKDILGSIQLTVSDIREGILHNLRKRFLEAGVNHQYAFVADLSKPLKDTVPLAPFDLIICDAPCSGSGTWGRTPEQKQTIQKKDIEAFGQLQEHIATNAWALLKKGGYLLYITCSVYALENEAVVQALAKKLDVCIIDSCILSGYLHHADTMYAALLQKIG